MNLDMIKRVTKRLNAINEKFFDHRAEVGGARRFLAAMDEQKLELIRECLKDPDLTDVSKLVIVNDIANPAPQAQAVLDWASSIANAEEHEQGEDK